MVFGILFFCKDIRSRDGGMMLSLPMIIPYCLFAMSCTLLSAVPSLSSNDRAPLTPHVSPSPIQHRRIFQMEDASFVCEKGLAFSAPQHYHAAYELIYVVSGSGMEFIGSGFAPYEAGSLTLIGSNTPHLHLCDRRSFGTATCEILYFSPRLFPMDLSAIPECRAIEGLLTRSRSGVRFTSTREIARTVHRMHRLSAASGISRITGLIELLDELGRSAHACCLAPAESVRSQPCGMDEPLVRIESYLQAHFREVVSLSEVAAHAGMTPTSLCRYFRRRTGKRLFDRLNGIRISAACRLLASSERTVAQVAAESGFRNLSHFNKEFRRQLDRTPTEYRRDLGLLTVRPRIEE